MLSETLKKKGFNREQNGEMGHFNFDPMGVRSAELGIST